jgi:hypothetical protein
MVFVKTKEKMNRSPRPVNLDSIEINFESEEIKIVRYKLTFPEASKRLEELNESYSKLTMLEKELSGHHQILVGDCRLNVIRFQMGSRLHTEACCAKSLHKSFEDYYYCFQRMRITVSMSITFINVFIELSGVFDGNEQLMRSLFELLFNHLDGTF